ncbi:Undecaprenyl-diphosphatase [Methylophaga frappieri]|uniref:Undecaprenyl-diphosphatase n=1 Tax=Methylophaga frappieri (strain ATCC BAA-2434 / DSM 25690 / JAM7) TaxID=754477 RepID=I1YIL2_METFJ|nr:undecaprenyl-diphosphate phosphatase [Methylophaga frappieri]AFJ02755.1 Undecaprenyl-diphosphatase [Methylophaga frappieri]
MPFLHILLLALLQGMTEFLPISSSAHLILLPMLADWQDQGLAFDVAVHVGTLSAIVFYFRGQLKSLILDWTNSVLKQRHIGDSRLAWAVGIATIPVGIAGLFFNDAIEFMLRNPLVIATTTIVFGILLGLADWWGKRRRDEHQLRWLDIIIIGCAQALALIPGTSRSGITMTAGLMLGLTRQAAARFSFLLSIPVILLAGGLKTVQLVVADSPTDWMVLFSGALFSAISAYLCVVIFMKMLDHIGMWPFVVYRLILGGVLFWLFL